MSRKGFANVWVGIAIAVIIAGAAAYVVLVRRPAAPSWPPPPPGASTPTPQTPVAETSDWKTYRNERYGFGIKYPPDVQVLTSQGTGKDFVDFQGGVAFTGGTLSPCRLEIEVPGGGLSPSLKVETRKFQAGAGGGTKYFYRESDGTLRFLKVILGDPFNPPSTRSIGVFPGIGVKASALACEHTVDLILSTLRHFP